MIYKPDSFSGLVTKSRGPGLVKIGKRLTPADVHVDRLSTTELLAYMQDDAQFVHRVFPTIPSDKQGGRFASYQKGPWLKSQLELRAPGARSAEVAYTATTTPYFIDVVGGHMSIDEQTETNADAPFNPRADTNAFLAAQVMLYKEIDWASTYFVTGVWANETTPNPLWSASNSTPLADIETGIYTIAGATGANPANMVLILGRKTWKGLKSNADLIGRINAGQTPNGPATATLSGLASVLGIGEVRVMGAIKNTADIGQTASLSFIGGDNDALLVYRNPRPGRLMPSAGYTYAWTGYLGANAEGGRVTSWYEPSLKANVMEVEFATEFMLTGTDLGYFFLNAVS